MQPPGGVLEGGTVFEGQDSWLLKPHTGWTTPNDWAQESLERKDKKRLPRVGSRAFARRTCEIFFNVNYPEK